MGSAVNRNHLSQQTQGSRAQQQAQVRSDRTSLEAAGIKVEEIDEHRLRVDGDLVYWPVGARWRSAEGAVSGYGLANLMAHVRKRAAEHPVTAPDAAA
jgi:hypothetical protein